MSVTNPKDQEAVDCLAANVRSLRTNKGLTLVQLAILCDVEYSTISRIERGLINTTISMVYKIARALEVHPSELLK